MPTPTASSPPAAADNAASRAFTVVTGATGGIGFAIAHQLARRRHKLLLVARTPEPLAAAAEAIRLEHQTEVATLAVDLTLPEALGLLDAELARLGAHVEMLVNSAGIGYCGAYDSMTGAELEQLIALNVSVPSRLMQHVLPDMRLRRRGGILNLASLGGYAPGPYQAAYYASKAYLISLSEAVATEVAADGVKLSVVAPGPVETGFHARMRAESAWYRKVLPSASPDTVARWALLGYDLGLKVVVPGLFAPLCGIAMRVVPHVLLLPLMAMLLAPRSTNERGSR